MTSGPGQAETQVARTRNADATLTAADAQLIRKTLAVNLRRQREGAGLSQDAPADISVVRRSTIQRIEMRKLRGLSVERLARASDISIWTLQ